MQKVTVFQTPGTRYVIVPLGSPCELLFVYTSRVFDSSFQIPTVDVRVFVFVLFTALAPISACQGLFRTACTYANTARLTNVYVTLVLSPGCLVGCIDTP